MTSLCWSGGQRRPLLPTPRGRRARQCWRLLRRAHLYSNVRWQCLTIPRSLSTLSASIITNIIIMPTRWPTCDRSFTFCSKRVACFHHFFSYNRARCHCFYKCHHCLHLKKRNLYRYQMQEVISYNSFNSSSFLPACCSYSSKYKSSCEYETCPTHLAKTPKSWVEILLVVVFSIP